MKQTSVDGWMAAWVHSMCGRVHLCRWRVLHLCDFISMLKWMYGYRRIPCECMDVYARPEMIEVDVDLNPFLTLNLPFWQFW